jgi:hypothetical protein
MKFEIHFEFRVSLRKFQDLNFWDATPEDRVLITPSEPGWLARFPDDGNSGSDKHAGLLRRRS